MEASEKLAEVEVINRVYGYKAALREAQKLGLDVLYDGTTEGNLVCFVKGEVVAKFKAN